MIAAFNPIALVLAIMCIQWVVVGTVAGQAIKLPYLGFAAIIAYTLLNRKVFAAAWLFARRNAGWLAPYAVYLVALWIALHGSKSEDTALKQAFYMCAAIGLGGAVAVTPRVSHVLRFGAGLGLALFVIFVEFLARRIGLSWIDAIKAFVLHGDLDFIVFSFLRPIFNSVDNGDVTFVASLKNSIAVCVFVCGFLFRAASTRPSRDIRGIIVLGLTILVLLLLNTRSVMIVAAFGIILAMGLSVAAEGARNRSVLALKAAAATMALVLAVGLSNPEGPVSTAMGTRYAFEDASAAARVKQATFAIEQIQAHPLLGSGYYEVDGEPIHNLFLSSWMEGGLVTFLLVAAFYLALLSHWLSSLWRFCSDRGKWVLPIAFEWIAPLPLLPLFRMWLSGDGGHPFLGEWVGIATFFGIVLANELRRRTLHARSASFADIPRDMATAGLVGHRNAHLLR